MQTSPRWHGAVRANLFWSIAFGLLTMAAFNPRSYAAQIISTDRTFNEAWQSAGYPGEIPAPANIVNVRDYGAVGNGVTDDTTAIRNAINALNNQPGVVYFPAGNYLVNSYYITLKSGTVFRGERTTNTTITIDYNLNHPINVTAAQSGAYQTITSGYTIHSYTLVVPDGSGFAAGDYAEIRESNDTSIGLPAQGSGYDYSVGQILRIASVAGNTLTLVNPIRVTYKASLTPQIRKIIPIQNAGIENIRFVRLVGSTTNATRNNKHTIEFNFAANCWVRGVETTNDFGAGVGVEYSTQVSVTGCYIHHPYEVDGGGSGYGVKLQFHPGECKFENNIFRKMRHSMALQAGANGNVFGYNYSREAIRTEFPTDAAGDVQVHGSFPFCNLFEGLIVGSMQMDNNSGPNGPLNTYFRCRTEGTYGILFTDAGSTNLNIVGNEVGGSGLYSYPGTSYTYGNNTSSGVQPAGATSIPDYSYYLNSDPSTMPALPSWWNIADTYPTIGLPLARTDTKNIPARARYLAGGYMTVGPPSLAKQPTNLVVNAGQTAAFSVQATGTPQALYQWYQDGVLLAGQTSATCTIANPQPANIGSYDVVISDDYGSVRSAAATLGVIGSSVVAPTIGQQPQSTNVCAGGTALFAVTASGDGTLTYQWQTNTVNLANGGHFSGATASNLTITAAGSGDAANYRCIVSNDGGSVTSSVASLTVNPTSVGGTATATASAVCSGSGTAVTLSGQTGSIVKWQSSPDGSSWSDIASTANPYSTGNLTATTYFRAVVLSGVCSAANSTAAQVTVNPVLTPSVSVSASPGTSVCTGTSVTFTATPANGGGAPSYVWKKNNVAVGGSGNTYTDAGLANGDQIDCQLTSNAGCASPTTASAAPLTMTVNSSPSVSSSPTNLTVTAGAQASFSAVAGGTPAPTVQWQISTNGGSSWNNLGGATSTTYNITAADADNANQYRAVFNNSCGTANSAAATLTVQPALVAPVAQFNGSPTNGVVPLVVTFTDNSTGTITDRFWDFGDGQTTNLTAAGIAHTYSAAGTNSVTLIVSGPGGASTNTQANLIVVTAYPSGDVNGDRHVTGSDSLLMNQVLVGLRASTSAVFAVTGFLNGDVNTNGTVTGSDSLLINQVLVGLRSYLVTKIVPNVRTNTVPTVVSIYGIGFPTNTVSAVTIGAPVNLTLSNVVVISREQINALVPAGGGIGTGSVSVTATPSNGVTSYGRFINQ